MSATAAAVRDRRGQKQYPERSRLTRAQRLAKDQVQAEIAAKMDKLREYADGLEYWYVHVVINGRPDDGLMHPRHVINGMRKIANEVSQPESKEKE